MLLIGSMIRSFPGHDSMSIGGSSLALSLHLMINKLLHSVGTDSTGEVKYKFIHVLNIK